jgi:hypothetical protein
MSTTDKRFGSHRAIIDAWPKLTDFAGDLDIPYGNAKAMRRRDRIGLEYVPAVVAKANARGIEGVTADLIAQLAADKAGRSVPEPQTSTSSAGSAS